MSKMNLKTIFEQPLKVFWFPIPVILILGFIFNGSIGIQAQESLISTTGIKLALWISGFFLFSGLAYYMFKPETLLPGLSSSHIKITTAGIVILVVMILLQDASPDKQGFKYFFRIDPREWLAILLFGLGLMIYFINGAIALFISLNLFKN